MLSRVVLASSLGLVATAHADEERRIEGVASNGGVGARYLQLDDRMFVDAQASGDLEQQGATLRAGLTGVPLLGLDHSFSAGFSVVRAAAGDEPLAAGDMPTHSPITSHLHRKNHRFLSVYINDTVRFIRGLDVTTGLVVRQWRNLGGDSTITYGSGPPMVEDTPYSSYLLAPTVSATAQVTESLALVAQTVAGTHEIGPSVTAGRVTAQARAFASPEVGAGAIGELSVQPVAPLVATIGYARTATLQRATTLLTFTDADILSVTARADTDAHLDALVARRIAGGVSAFVGVDNLLDRRATDAAPRLVHAGLRGYFASGTP